MTKVALLGIGQSPPDVPLTTQDVDFSTVGSVEICNPLDSYSLAQLQEQFAPTRGEFPISACIADGSRIAISRSRLVPELNMAIRKLEHRGFTTIVLDCTGDFQDLVATQTTNLVLPGLLLKETVLGHMTSSTKDYRSLRIAVIVPIDDQQALLRARWHDRTGGQVDAYTISPLASLKDFVTLGNRANGRSYDLVIMDCMGYSVAQADAIKKGASTTFLAKNVVIDYLSKGMCK